jgi:purine-binding chemotaxis protein CheW
VTAGNRDGDPRDGDTFFMQNKAQSTGLESGTAPARQLLTFALGDEVYGVDILRLKEIRGWSPVTRLPHSPPAVLGVLNLRGVVVPIIDLRIRFGLPAADFTPITVIIVLSLRTEHGDQEFGIVVDKVMDVVDISPDEVKPTPATAASAAGEVIEGIATVGDQMLILLDAQRLIFREPSPVPSQAAA